MADLWIDVDTAVIVPVNLLPLLDDTDFKSIETAVLYNAAGLALTWNFVTCAGVVTGVAVTPTTGGVYDWSEPVADKGMYAIEIPASGGASANNDTEGVGWFTGVATGVLPWRGPTIGFRRAALNDLLIEGGTASTNLEDFLDGTGYAGGTAKLTVDVAKISGDANAADNLETACDGGSYNVGGGAVVAASVTGVVGSVTGAVGSVTGAVGSVTGAVGSVTGAVGSVTGNVGGSVASVTAGVTLAASAVQAIWDALTSVLTAAGSIGKKLADWVIGTTQTGDSYTRLGAPAGASVSADIAAVKADTAAIETDTQDLQTKVGAAGAGLTALGDARIANLNATVSSRSSHSAADVKTALEGDGSKLDAIYDKLPSGNIGDATAANQNAIAGYIDTEVGAILAAVDTEVGAIKSETAAILEDTAQIGAAGAGLTALGDARIANLNATVSSRSSHSAADVKTALEADGAKLDHLWEMTEDDAGLRRLTTNALEQAPTGGSAPTVQQIRAEIDSNSTQLAAIVEDTAQIGAAGGGLTALGDTRLAKLDATVSSRLATAGYTAPPSAVTIAATVGAGQPASESYAAKGALPTRDQAILGILQLLSERSIADVTMTVKKLNGSTPAMTFTLDDPTTPTAITRAT